MPHRTISASTCAFWGVHLAKASYRSRRQQPIAENAEQGGGVPEMSEIIAVLVLVRRGELDHSRPDPQGLLWRQDTNCRCSDWHRHKFVPQKTR